MIIIGFRLPNFQAGVIECCDVDYKAETNSTDIKIRSCLKDEVIAWILHYKEQQLAHLDLQRLVFKQCYLYEETLTYRGY